VPDPARAAAWRGFATIEPGRPARFPGGWDEVSYLRARDACGFLRGRSLVPVPPGPGPRCARLVTAGARIPGWLAAVRDRLSGRVESLLGGDAGRLAGSFLFGPTRAGPGGQEWLGPFRRAGLMHVVAVSGLQVGLVAGILALVLGFLPVGWRGRSLALAGAVAAYASLVGWSASVTRAAVVAGGWAVLRAAGRRPEPRALLLGVLAASLWLQPGAWRDPGFRLSYLVSLALLGASRAVRGAARVPAAWFAAQATAWPLVLAQQGSGSPLFLATNGLLVPLAGLLPLVVVFASLGSLLPGFPHDICLAPARGFLDLFLDLVGVGASICDRWPVGSSPGAEMGLALGASVAALWSLDGPRARLRLAATILLCAGAVVLGRPPARAPAFLMLDVGQGESWLLVWRRETWLVDAGPPPGEADRPPAVIAPVLRSLGRRRLERVFLTHDDADHAGGLAELAAQGIEVGAVHPAVGLDPSAPTRAFLRRALERGARLEPVRRGDTLRCREGRLVVLHPPAGAGPEDDNARSLVLRVEVEGLVAVISGDAPGPVLEACLGADPRGPAPCVLSAAHHGSASSTPETVLRRLRPDAVLISAGRGNRFGHPSPAVLERARRAGAAVFRTDRDGTVALARRGGAWTASRAVSLRAVALRGICPGSRAQEEDP
jgi:competence protein ComEC